MENRGEGQFALLRGAFDREKKSRPSLAVFAVVVGEQTTINMK